MSSQLACMLSEGRSLRRRALTNQEANLFAGHVGAALAIGRAVRRINVGLFIFAALLLDVALWIFVLLGWESATIPADFAATHQAEFVFPYSHGLLAGIAWSGFAGAAVILVSPPLKKRRLRCAGFVGAAVFSHWLLDALVHVPELPLAGAESTKVGFGLWQDMPVALTLEATIVVLGLWLFVPGATLSRTRKLGLIALCVLILGFTVAGMTVAPPPPSVAAMAGSALATIIVVCAIAFWLGNGPDEKRTGSDFP